MSLTGLRRFALYSGLGPTTNGFGLPDSLTVLQQIYLIEGRSKLSRTFETTGGAERRSYWGPRRRILDADKAVLRAAPDPVPKTPEEFSREIERARAGLRGRVDVPFNLRLLAVFAPGIVAFVCLLFFNGLLKLDFVTVTNWYFYVVGTLSFFLHLLTFLGFVSLRTYIKTPNLVLSLVVVQFFFVLTLIGTFFSLYETAFHPPISEKFSLLHYYREFVLFYADSAALRVEKLAYDLVTGTVIAALIAIMRGILTPGDDRE